MPLLSTFLRFRIFDDTGRRFDLDDVAVALLESDYPAVTHFVCQNSEHRRMMLSWDAVTGIDWPHSRIHVKNFDTAQPATDGSLRQEGLLKRDVLDALVLDLCKRVATRAYDLSLEKAAASSKAVDTSSLAVLRRLSKYLVADQVARCPTGSMSILRGDPMQ
jgi:hypothetical protein